MSELDELGDEPVYNQRRPTKEPLGPVGHFISTALAVWLGGVLAAGTVYLFFSIMVAREVGKLQAEREQRAAERVR